MEKGKKSKRKLIIIVSIIAIIISFIVIGLLVFINNVNNKYENLSNYDKKIYDCVKKLKDSSNTPEQFRLYDVSLYVTKSDEILNENYEVVPNNNQYNIYPTMKQGLLITCGGPNAFGGIVKNYVAVIMETDRVDLQKDITFTNTERFLQNEEYSAINFIKKEITFDYEDEKNLHKIKLNTKEIEKYINQEI